MNAPFPGGVVGQGPQIGMDMNSLLRYLQEVTRYNRAYELGSGLAGRQAQYGAAQERFAPAFGRFESLIRDGAFTDAEEKDIVRNARDGVIRQLRLSSEAVGENLAKRGTSANPLAVASMNRDATLAGAREAGDIETRLKMSEAEMKNFGATAQAGAAGQFAGFAAPTVDQVADNISQFESKLPKFDFQKFLNGLRNSGMSGWGGAGNGGRYLG